MITIDRNDNATTSDLEQTLAIARWHCHSAFRIKRKIVDPPKTHPLAFLHKNPHYPTYIHYRYLFPTLSSVLGPKLVRKMPYLTAT